MGIAGSWAGLKIVGRAVVAAIALLLFGGTAIALAQVEAPPPWPVLYDGEAFLDGQPIADGAVQVRVGDWSSDWVPVVDGTFRCGDPCLLAGPPTADYLGEPVTFHLEGFPGPASYRFDFPKLIEPKVEQVQLFFGIVPNDGGFPWLLPVGIVIGLGVVGGAAYFAQARRSAAAGT